MRIVTYPPAPEPEELTRPLGERGHELTFAIRTVFDGPPLTPVGMLAVAGGRSDRLLSVIVPESIAVEDAGEAASEIAAWAEALPTLPAR